MFQQFPPPPPSNTSELIVPAPAVAKAAFNDSLKNGIYTATFTDPTNKWRCYPAVSGYGEHQVFTLVCVQTHEIKDEGKQ